MVQQRKELTTKKERDALPNFKTYANPCTLSSYDCGICLVQGITTVALPKGVEESYWASPSGGVLLAAEQGVMLSEPKPKSKIFNFNSRESFDFEEKLFEELKEYGFNSMHKYIR